MKLKVDQNEYDAFVRFLKHAVPLHGFKTIGFFVYRKTSEILALCFTLYSNNACIVHSIHCAGCPTWGDFTKYSIPLSCLPGMGFNLSIENILMENGILYFDCGSIRLRPSIVNRQSLIVNDWLPWVNTDGIDLPVKIFNLPAVDCYVAGRKVILTDGHFIFNFPFEDLPLGNMFLRFVCPTGLQNSSYVKFFEEEDMIGIRSSNLKYCFHSPSELNYDIFRMIDTLDSLAQNQQAVYGHSIDCVNEQEASMVRKYFGESTTLEMIPCEDFVRVQNPSSNIEGYFYLRRKQ